MSAVSPDPIIVADGAPVRTALQRLLVDLLRPYRRVLALLMVVVVLENAARLSVPKLVQLGIDDDSAVAKVQPQPPPARHRVAHGADDFARRVQRAVILVRGAVARLR